MKTQEALDVLVQATAKLTEAHALLGRKVGSLPEVTGGAFSVKPNVLQVIRQVANVADNVFAAVAQAEAFEFTLPAQATRAVGKKP